MANEEREHTQFGNNFYLLFETMRRAVNDPESAEEDALVQIYLRRAERLEQWPVFVQNNPELLKGIFGAIESLAPYRLHEDHYVNLLRQGRFDEADEYAATSNYEEIGIGVWDRLNPLLEQAAQKLEGLGIDPVDFFG